MITQVIHMPDSQEALELPVSLLKMQIIRLSGTY